MAGDMAYQQSISMDIRRKAISRDAPWIGCFRLCSSKLWDAAVVRFKARAALLPTCAPGVLPAARHLLCSGYLIICWMGRWTYVVIFFSIGVFRCSGRGHVWHAIVQSGAACANAGV